MLSPLPALPGLTWLGLALATGTVWVAAVPTVTSRQAVQGAAKPEPVGTTSLCLGAVETAGSREAEGVDRSAEGSLEPA